jgi:poly(A) polymerase
MLRVVRFAAKLGFDIAPTTRAPIAVMATLINNVPAARVFDEMLKMLTSGHALACLKQLRQEGLHHGLLPLLDVVLEQPLGAKFVTLALNNTDERIRQGKTVSPGFLFAALLWHQVLEKWQAYQTSGEFPIPALHLAADDVLQTQTETLALQRRIASDMRDIWAMQPRFERCVGKSPYKLIEHPRFRAGLDFLVLRAASGEIDQETGEWWTAFLAADMSEREALLNSARTVKKPTSAPSARKPQVKQLATDGAPETEQPAPKPRRRRRAKKPAASE